MGLSTLQAIAAVASKDGENYPSGGRSEALARAPLRIRNSLSLSVVRRPAVAPRARGQGTRDAAQMRETRATRESKSRLGGTRDSGSLCVKTPQVQGGRRDAARGGLQVRDVGRLPRARTATKRARVRGSRWVGGEEGKKYETTPRVSCSLAEGYCARKTALAVQWTASSVFMAAVPGVAYQLLNNLNFVTRSVLTTV